MELAIKNKASKDCNNTGQGRLLNDLGIVLATVEGGISSDEEGDWGVRGGLIGEIHMTDPPAGNSSSQTKLS